MIKVEGIAKRFGAVEAVSDVSFVAEDGQVTGILGPNGAGKTTTLRMLATLLSPDRGHISVDGVDVAAAPTEARSKLGVVGHAGGLYPRLTAMEHIRYFAELHGLSRRDADTRAADLIKTLGMEGISARRAAGFSQGEKLKVALARALVHAPSHVVLDEPSNGLDVMSTRAVRDIIRGFRDQGKCVLFSTHIMQEVTALCDRIVVIHKGRVVAAGTPAAIREQGGRDSLEDAFVAIVGTGEGLV
jgi:sodium transport system ATP-binding protein